MSNLSGRNKNQKKPTQARTKPSPGADEISNKSKRWTFIQNDLENALDTWEELEKSQAGMSPEEEQFEKIKTIIGQLKDKLNQF